MPRIYKWETLPAVEIIELYQTGIPCNSIAIRYNVAFATIRRVLMKHGFPPPSIRHATGNTNPAWKGGRSRTYIRKVGEAALQAAGRDTEHCERCDATENKERHHIHHRDQDIMHNTADNLHILCRPCHISIHNSTRLETDFLRFLADGEPF